MELKGRYCKLIIWSIVLYGLECWVTKKQYVQNISVTKWERSGGWDTKC